jgi:methylated-DNA-protein-cysteine methyltransferase-like protein
VPAKRTPPAESRWTKFYAVIRRIPRGKVATYGQIARLAGLPGHARQVGYALFALKPSTSVPWQRVINAAGRISLRATAGAISQRLLLEREGVRFVGDRVSLPAYGWRPGANVRRGGARAGTRARRAGG